MAYVAKSLRLPLVYWQHLEAVILTASATSDLNVAKLEKGLRIESLLKS